MRAGRLRHRVTLQAYTATQDDYGQEIEDWADIAERWAEVAPLMGREFFSSQQTAAEATHRVRLRYDAVTAALKPKDRILYQGRIFDIDAPVQNAQGRNSELVVMCKELV